MNSSIKQKMWIIRGHIGLNYSEMKLRADNYADAIEKASKVKRLVIRDCVLFTM